jgi:hypothetical protein
MAVFRLVYMSKRAPSAPLYIDDLISVSRQRNRQAGVTGFLVFDGQNFAQALEGKRREVTQIYNRIAADDRHYELHLVSCVDTAARLFPGWAMGLLSDIPPESRDRFLSFFALARPFKAPR